MKNLLTAAILLLTLNLCAQNTLLPPFDRSKADDLRIDNKNEEWGYKNSAVIEHDSTVIVPVSFQEKKDAYHGLIKLNRDGTMAWQKKMEEEIKGLIKIDNRVVVFYAVSGKKKTDFQLQASYVDPSNGDISAAVTVFDTKDKNLKSFQVFSLTDPRSAAVIIETAGYTSATSALGYPKSEKFSERKFELLFISPELSVKNKIDYSAQVRKGVHLFSLPGKNGDVFSAFSLDDNVTIYRQGMQGTAYDSLVCWLDHKNLTSQAFYTDGNSQVMAYLKIVDGKGNNVMSALQFDFASGKATEVLRTLINKDYGDMLKQLAAEKKLDLPELKKEIDHLCPLAILRHKDKTYLVSEIQRTVFHTNSSNSAMTSVIDWRNNYVITVLNNEMKNDGYIFLERVYSTPGSSEYCSSSFHIRGDQLFIVSSQRYNKLSGSSTLKCVDLNSRSICNSQGDFLAINTLVKGAQTVWFSDMVMAFSDERKLLLVKY